jgi:hypothetical protein
MDRASEQESGRNARESAEQVGFAGHAELPRLREREAQPNKGQNY